MIAKVIVWDESRPRAIMKMIETLKETIIFGVKTNIPFLVEMLQHPEFVDGSLNTNFIQTHFSTGSKEQPMTDQENLLVEKSVLTVMTSGGEDSRKSSANPWVHAWRNS